MYIHRTIEKTIENISRTFPVLLVTGARQVGKTTLLKHLAKEDRTYVTLDNPVLRELAKNEPALFLQRYSPPLLIDEIQYAPELLPYIKMHVDRTEVKGDYWLTGSQMFHLMKHVSESLAGRVGIAHLLGFSSREIQGIPSEPFVIEHSWLQKELTKVQRLSLMEVYQRIFAGGMPAIQTTKDLEHETFFASYVETYLLRDIKELTQIADEMRFLSFMSAVAARTAKPLVYEEIARDVGISAPTAKQWLSILVSSQIVALVQPYANNMLKRIVKTPLLHFLDTGLCAYLLRWNSPETLERGIMSGPFLESWVFSEIYKSYIHNGQRPPIFYYRDRDKKEIDLLIEQNGKLHPLEIKKSASPGKHSTRHFSVLEPVSNPKHNGTSSPLKVELGEGAVVCLIDDLIPIDSKNWFVPAWLI
ncbi:MAG: ATP-binding protein [Spirochaetota bacterium]